VLLATVLERLTEIQGFVFSREKFKVGKIPYLYGKVFLIARIISASDVELLKDYRDDASA